MPQQLAEPDVMVMLLSRQPAHLSEAEKWRRAAQELAAMFEDDKRPPAPPPPPE